MRLDFDLKTLASFVVSLLLVLVQYLNGVYDGGVNGLEWLGLGLVLFGPAGLVAAVNNTPWSPATKALAQAVSTVGVVVVQGVMDVYDGGVSTQEWLAVGLLLLSTLAVYVVPGTNLRRGARV